jgi:hypothetical protein
MFGYPAIFFRGHMIAGLVRDRKVLRLADRDPKLDFSDAVDEKGVSRPGSR